MPPEICSQSSAHPGQQLRQKCIPQMGQIESIRDAEGATFAQASGPLPIPLVKLEPSGPPLSSRQAFVPRGPVALAYGTCQS